LFVFSLNSCEGAFLVFADLKFSECIGFVGSFLRFVGSVQVKSRAVRFVGGIGGGQVSTIIGRIYSSLRSVKTSSSVERLELRKSSGCGNSFLRSGAQ